MDIKIKICSKCGFVGEESLFGKGNICKKCKAEYDKKYSLEPQEERKKYEEKNKDKIKKQQRDYDASHKEERATYKRERRKKDTLYKIMENNSRAINKMLESKNATKNGESSKLRFSFTKDILYSHIEKQFSLSENLDNTGKVWMNWSNHGKYNLKLWIDSDLSTYRWNLDHHIPKSLLPYSSMDELNFKICWHLLNLRPLLAKQNILENNRRNPEEMEMIKQIIIKDIMKTEKLTEEEFNNKYYNKIDNINQIPPSTSQEEINESTKIIK